MSNETRTTPPNGGTQTCKSCGRELPIEKFARAGFGLRHTCNECMATKSVSGRKKTAELEQLRKQLTEARQLRLHDFQPRELMAELHRRGYEGTLTYVERKTIDITKI